MENHSFHANLMLAISWAGTVASGLTKSDILFWATLVFTLLQIVIAVRKIFWPTTVQYIATNNTPSKE